MSATEPEKYSDWSIFVTAVSFKIYNLRKIRLHEYCKIEHLILSD